MGTVAMTKINKMIDYKKDDNQITITEKAGFLYGDEFTPNLYNSEMSDAIKIADYDEIKPKDSYIKITDEFKNTLYKKYSDKFTIYKHTFKKNENGDYYWYSTKLVK